MGLLLPGIATVPPPNSQSTMPLRDGTPIEKNVSLSEQKMIKLQKKLEEKITFWSAYPDLWVDELLVPTGSSFNLMFYQRIMMRNMARKPLNHVTAARGVSKTFITLLMAFHKCIFCPKSTIAFAAPNKTQSAQIGRQTVNDLLNRFPILNMELDGPVIGGKDYFEVRFRNGSKIEITAALESTRGRRFDAMDVDEARDQDGDNVNGILVPTVSKTRVTAGQGIVNPYEPHQCQTYTSSASSKSSYNYGKVIDLLEKMIMHPSSAWVMGLDYRVPVIEGIYPASFVRDIRSDATMNDQLFAREYLSIFTAESEESWFNFKKLNRHRKMVNAEWEARKSNGNADTFYLISVDVGRIHDNTVATIFKVIPNKGRFRAVVVNIFMLGRTDKTKQFNRQATDLKRLIESYRPKEVIIDTNGLGVGLAEYMIQKQVDANGKEYPAYGFYNDDTYKKIQPPNAPKILCSFKTNHKINSEMFSNCYSRVDAGLVDFLITEQEARSKLLATKKGQAMSAEYKTKFLMPYEMTTRLFEEMGNLKLKQVGLDIVLEPINTRFPDDRFSSLCIGLRRIKELEEESTKRRNRGGKRTFVFYS